MNTQRKGHSAVPSGGWIAFDDATVYQRALRVGDTSEYINMELHNSCVAIVGDLAAPMLAIPPNPGEGAAGQPRRNPHHDSRRMPERADGPSQKVSAKCHSCVSDNQESSQN